MARQFKGWDAEKRGIQTFGPDLAATNIERPRDFESDNSVELGSTDEGGLAGANVDNQILRAGGYGAIKDQS